MKAGDGLLALLVAIAVGSVAYWYWSEMNGAGNLIPYLLMQACFILAILLVTVLFPPRHRGGDGMPAVAALYAAALAADFLDKPVFALGEIVSGHTLKHLFAALSVYWVLRMLRRRHPARLSEAR